jgi:hypothetical protein
LEFPRSDCDASGLRSLSTPTLGAAVNAFDPELVHKEIQQLVLGYFLDDVPEKNLLKISAERYMSWH